jgi:hypothetical protein
MAGVIALVFILLGIGGFAWGLVNAIRDIRIDERFGSGEAVTVRMVPQTRTGIYAREAVSGATPDAECAVTSPSGRNIPVTTPGGRFTMTVNGVTWYEIYVINTTEAGDHQVRCVSNGTSALGTAAFATGKHPDAGFFGGLVGGIASLFVLPLIGLITAGVIATVTGVKRGDHRKRLIAERYGRPQAP